MNGRLFIVSAPSGAGKTSLVEAVLKKLQPIFPIERVITYSSKTPRTTEMDGRDYHFIPLLEFEQKIKEDFFLEWSGEYGTYYGTPSSILRSLQEGSSLIVILDPKGAQSLVKHVPEAVTIWISVESLMVLQYRLQLRGTENQDQIQKRLSLAQKEILDEQQNRFFNHHVLNVSFAEAQKTMENIIIQALQLSTFSDRLASNEYVD